MPPPCEQELCTANPSEGTHVIGIMLDGLKKVAVHAHLLAHHSMCFRELNNQASREYFCVDFCPYATDQTVCFFVRWIYGRSLGPYNLNEGLRKLCRGEQYETLIRSLLFGEKIEATEFQRDIMRCITEDIDCVDLAVSVDIWIDIEVMAPSSRLRPFLVDMCCAKLRGNDADRVDVFLKDLPRSMLEDISQRMITGPCRPRMDMDFSKYLK
ncbi:hypothetical protein F4813DRAFT_336503 [Daldinia decipiens]|uniref:uncharacterized protein n=1 Tax=Daldinia decipiens TaxID=326647 RepID=UPI0020C45B7C|nr:uncharacterized protein F4813DRAFT_336503 [Daldinia decipiens]KAI1659552.1 hypothetical protein F4813DRAFT_336503 [Daldinia decipiens]